jgi:diguanylate cyclase (GGDEF)-like protein/PAS domain S-box-containing protein
MRLKILIVEDSSSDAALIEMLLKGISIFSVELINTKTLEASLQTMSESLFDLILLDLGLPDSQGLNTLHVIHEKVPEVPIVILTGFEDEEIAIGALQEGAQDYLLKNEITEKVVARSIRYSIERQQIFRKLQESEQRFRKLANVAPAAIFMINENKITYANKLALCYTGSTWKEVQGRDIVSFFAPACHDQFEVILKQLCDKTIESGRMDLVFVDTEGNNRRWVDVSISLMQVSDEEHVLLIGYDISERKILEKKLIETARTDTLTGISNRLRFDEVLKSEMMRTDRTENTFALMLFDIDDFKAVNDRYGHQQGDRVLIEIARIVSAELRSYDTLARWGGEEFTILAPDMDAKGALTLANKVHLSVKTAVFEGIGHIGISIGVTLYRLNESQDQLIKRVDDALYKAKSEGKDRVVSSFERNGDVF